MSIKQESSDFTITSIGIMKSPFKQKLGTPRQPGLGPSVYGDIILHKDYAREDTLRRIESFSHLWIIFWCHESHSWRETVKAPRLGGKEKVGVFACRSPHRPNPLGLSVVKLEEINSDFSLRISDFDILDGTPILDIKPYLPMWDALPNAQNGWIDETQNLIPIPVTFAQDKAFLESLLGSSTLKMIEETLRWDPRPSYSKGQDRSFTHQFDHFDIQWKFQNNTILIESIIKKSI